MFPDFALKRHWKIILSSPPIPWTCLAHKIGSSTEMSGLRDIRIGKSAVDRLISQGRSAAVYPRIPSASGTSSCELGGEPESIPILWYPSISLCKVGKWWWWRSDAAALEKGWHKNQAPPLKLYGLLTELKKYIPVPISIYSHSSCTWVNPLNTQASKLSGQKPPLTVACSSGLYCKHSYVCFDGFLCLINFLSPVIETF